MFHVGPKVLRKMPVSSPPKVQVQTMIGKFDLKTLLSCWLGMSPAQLGQPLSQSGRYDTVISQ